MKRFDSIADASEWMREECDHDCIDNERFAWKDDHAAVFAYQVDKSHGCCGFFDAEVEINGRVALIGCNYGH